MKAITHKLKQSLLIWLFVILPLAGLSPTLMADDEAAPPEAETTEEPASSDTEEAESTDEEAEAGPVDDYQGLLDNQGEYAPAFDFFTTSMLWTVIAAAMVFIMHLGFSALEVGLTRAKNTVNILFKNAFIISIGLLTYAICGFNTHYPGSEFDAANGWFSWGSMIGDLNGDGGDTWGYGGLSLAMTGYGDFIFQAMFAALSLIHI